MPTSYIVIALIFVFIAKQIWKLYVDRARENHIRTFSYPRGIFAKVIKKYPHLSQKDMELVSQGLRQFFMAYQKSGRKYISMPSQVADELWHEFILYTKDYQKFTQQAFGTFLHHTPAAVLSDKSQSNAGLRRCWKYVCKEEHINPLKPLRLPLLFSLDAKFNIGDGYQYVADCSGLRQANGTNISNIHCGGDFSDSSIDGGTDGLDDSSSDGGDSGDGGSDGGGCGGGCGGD
jgi:hypothetical protein